MENKCKTPLSILTSVILSIVFSAQANAANVPEGVSLAEKQVLVRGNDAEAATLDPLLAEGMPEMHILRDLFEGLVIQDENGKVIPGVAEKWENKGNQIYTFHLRKDAQWSNGDPVTANDFLFSLLRVVDPNFASPNAWYLKLTEIKNAKAIIEGKMPVESLGVKVLDAYTLEFELDKPVPYFIAMTAHTAMMPLHAKTVLSNGDKWARPETMVSNGAFKLSEWVINERIELERNENYWDNSNTVLNHVTYIPFENQNSALNRYKTGEVDMTSDVPAQMAIKIKETYPDDYRVTPLLCTYYYAFNTQHKPFDDPKVRKAAAYSIKRDVITDGITNVGNEPAFTFAHKDVAGFKATLPDYAKLSQKEREEQGALLAKEAGFDEQNPIKAKLLYNTSESHKTIAIAIASMLDQNLGAQIMPENQEWKSYLSARKSGDFDILRASWCGDYNEASTFLSLFTSDNERNYAFYKNDEYDLAISNAQMATNEKERNLYYDQAESILVKDMPVAPIYFYMQARLVKPTIGGFPMHNAEGRIYSKDLYIKAK
ncbi:peptide ABC transporter substrate-binding protein [Vibrio sp. VB16]|uniref:peptide ABC transporter substrate-binding protein n=1 Tax=Vibrio sp. VB16 TaxID=2785746 RepID=UPI00189F4086|nr:peptide ABC transporter substrate-binding protein [Vibrio sp. VB16]UGA56226.1 peptide ABC transporter substrate-binding protein [Vibrio sp. VB16]